MTRKLSGDAMRLTAIRLLQFSVLVLGGAAAIDAQSGIRFTATSENVSGAGEPIRIDLTGWSTDSQRDELVAAWTLTAPAPAPARGGRGGRGGRGAAAQPAQAAQPQADLPVDPDAVDLDSPAFRFGRGGARGGPRVDDPALRTPEGSLAAAVKKAPTVGILWTSETVGYSIKYAYRLSQPDGGERIILATDRRVGAWSNLWKPAPPATPSDYAFSIIELRLNPRGDGEGRGLVTGTVTVDKEARTIALDGYANLPVILKSVKRQSGN